MAHLARLEQLEDLAPGQRRLEAAVLEALHRAHRLSLYAPCSRRFSRPLPRLAACSRSLAACGVPRIPGITPYRIEIQQGNFVSQEMVSQLKPGMSKEQVRLAARHAAAHRHLPRRPLGLRLLARGTRRQARAAQARGVLRRRQARARRRRRRRSRPRMAGGASEGRDRRRRRPHGPHADRGGRTPIASSSSAAALDVAGSAAVGTRDRAASRSTPTSLPRSRLPTC